MKKPGGKHDLVSKLGVWASDVRHRDEQRQVCRALAGWPTYAETLTFLGTDFTLTDLDECS